MGEPGKRRRAPELASFGDRIRELREEAGLTQEELAERAGFHRTVVGFIERGQRNPTISHVWPLARALKVEASALFELPHQARSGKPRR